MPKHRRYDLAQLWMWIWLQDNGVTARQIAEHLGCSARYVTDRILPSLELHRYYLAQTGQQKTGRRSAAVFSPMRPDDNDREKF